MKTSKIILMTLIMCFIYVFSYSQERVNRKKLSFLDKSDIITNAVGWSYNSTLGEWVDYQNVISTDKNYKTKWLSLQGSYMMSRLDQNFISIQTKTIMIDTLKYYVLMVEKWVGSYEYPSIQENWREYKKMFGYVFSENEFNKLLNFNDEVKIETQYVVVMGSLYEKYDETIFLDLLQTEMNKTPSKYSSPYNFSVRKTEKGEIRFHLPYWERSYYKLDFNQQYFETTIVNFSKIL